MRNKQTF